MSSWTPVNRPVRPQTDRGNKSNSVISTTSNNTNNDTISTSGHGDQLRNWQAHALQIGRTPLPESPGDRPWLILAPNSQFTAGQENQLQTWQAHALQNGRYPLPDSLGKRPWLDLASASHTTGGPLLSSSLPTDTSASTGPTENGNGGISYPSETSYTEEPALTYRFWTENEMRRLITLRNSGVSWPEVYESFSHRTPEAIKQAYHKRRHAIERMMEMETTVKSGSNKT
ncbi:hypothetical protein FHETE_10614 [Fusarium heterosporum]|uniref:Myb-like domain-containing protein n=1 Tax=Fusarium heterosporum TaxID=42747 RepID=A0A8H5SUJ6_FUSHE|nr:hypothetical protein FHETE_10614 [Fusarium heterosporum]